MTSAPSREDLVEPPEAPVDRLEEPLLLREGGIVEIPALRHQLGVDGAHLAHHDVGQRGKGRLAAAQEPRVAHGPAQDPPEDVAAALVARIDAIGEEEAHCPRMVGENPVRALRAWTSTSGSERADAAHPPPSIETGGKHRCGSCRLRPA